MVLVPLLPPRGASVHGGNLFSATLAVVQAFFHSRFEIWESSRVARSFSSSGRQASSASCAMRARSNLRLSRSLDAASASILGEVFFCLGHG